jgi:hypothetical protein
MTSGRSRIEIVSASVGHYVIARGIKNFTFCGLMVAGLSLHNLRYADYTTLVVSEPAKLIRAVKQVSLKFGLHHNIKKTVIMSNTPIIWDPLKQQMLKGYC